MSDLLMGSNKSDNSLGTSLYILPIPAETNVEEDDEENQGENSPSEKKKKKKNITCDFQKIGPFHSTQITVIREFQHQDYFLTCSVNGEVIIWNLKTRQVV